MIVSSSRRVSRLYIKTPMNYHADAAAKAAENRASRYSPLPIGSPATMPPQKTPAAVIAQTLRPLLTFGSLLAMTGAATVSAQSESAATVGHTVSGSGIMVDWRNRSELPLSLLAQLRSACCGMFVEPALTGAYIDLDPDQAPTEIETLSPVRQPIPGQFYVDGAVTVQQGYRSLRASEGMHLDEDTNILTLQGSVSFREPGFLVVGTGARLDQTSGDNEITRASYVMHNTQIHGSAGRLSYNSNNGMLTLENGEFSRCEPMDPFWIMQAQSLRLDNERGIGYAADMTLRIRDVPVFYYPWTLQFPIGDQRVSGILPPALSNSRDGGIDLAVPYYFNLAPHYDATLTPRIMTERGLMLGAEFRYLADWSMNSVDLTLMPKDRSYDPIRAQVPGSSSPAAERRWFAGFEHEGRIGSKWRTYVDFNAVSDEDYFRDLGSRDLNIESRTHLNREGVISWQDNNWLAETRLQRIEVLDPYIASIDINKPFDRLPELRLSGQFDTSGRLRYGFDASAVSFDRSLNRNLLSAQQVAQGALVTAERITAEPWLSLPVRGAGYFMIPTARYRYTQWHLSNQAMGTPSDPTRGVAVFSLDSGLIFDRSLNWNSESMTQTLEPRLYYLYSERKAQQHLPTFDTAQLNLNFNQLFRPDRFSGADRVGDANQISAAVTSRFVTTDGFERARLSAGQIFHLADRTVALDSPLQSWLQLQPMDTDRSALILEGMYRPHQRWQVAADLQWDQENSNIDEGSLAFQYRVDEERLFNLAYRYRERTDVFLQAPPLLDPIIRQTDLSAVWPVNDNWRMFGRWNYDHSNRRNLETFAGVEYSNCCATMRVVARDWVNEYEFFDPASRKNRGLFFQMTLLGLGDLTGGGLSNLLTRGIPGFKEYNVND